MELAFLALILFGPWLYFLLQGRATPEIKMDIGLLVASILLLAVGTIFLLHFTLSAMMSDDWAMDFGLAGFTVFLISIVSLALGCAGLIKLARKLRHW